MRPRPAITGALRIYNRTSHYLAPRPPETSVELDFRQTHRPGFARRPFHLGIEIVPSEVYRRNPRRVQMQRDGPGGFIRYPLWKVVHVAICPDVGSGSPWLQLRQPPNHKGTWCTRSTQDLLSRGGIDPRLVGVYRVTDLCRWWKCSVLRVSDGGFPCADFVA